METFKFIIYREESARVEVEANDIDQARELVWDIYTDGDYEDEFNEDNVYIE